MRIFHKGVEIVFVRSPVINKNAYNPTGRESGFDTQETKLPTYWNTSFTKICLGMKIGQHINFIVIDKQANSLYSLIADGQYCATSLGRDAWKTLIGSRPLYKSTVTGNGSTLWALDPILKKESFSLVTTKMTATAVIPESDLAQGGTTDDFNTCGNEATAAHNNGNRNIKAIGYILVHWEETDDKLSYCIIVIIYQHRIARLFNKMIISLF